jgi:zinc protease
MNSRVASVLSLLVFASACDPVLDATTKATAPAPTVVKPPASAPTQAKDPSIPAHPDQLKYGALEWKIPTAEEHRSVLKNGMVVYAIEDRSLAKTDMSILMRAGQFWEPKGKEGLASMTGNLMRTGGTEKMPAEALDERLEFLAIQLGVSVGDTQANASLGALSKDLDEGMSILADVLGRPAFRQDKVDLYKAQLLNSMRARNDNPGSIESREASLLLYGDFPVNRHPTKASIESITREDLVGYHKRFFHPGNMIVAAAGDFSKTEFLAKLEKLFADWPTPPAEKVTIPKVEHTPTPGVYCFQTRQPFPQGRFTIGHAGIDLNHPDLPMIRVMSYIFGAGSFASRLVKVVRTDAGLAYSVGCNYSPGIAYTGTFRMSFQSKSESCLYAAKLCMDELAKMQNEDVPEEELKGAINFYLDGFPGFFFATPAATAQTLATAEFNNYPKDYSATYREKVSKITAADIRRVAKEHMRPDKLVYVVVGNLPAIKGGDGKHDVKLEEFGKVQDVPLPDPMTLERPSSQP